MTELLPTYNEKLGDGSVDKTALNSDESVRYGSDSGKTSDADEHAPEALVRKDTEAVNLTRFAIVVTLLGATIATAYMVHRTTSNAQRDLFQTSYESVGNNIASSLLAAMSEKFWMGKTISESVTLLLGYANTTANKLSIEQGEWERLTKEARFQGRVHMTSWSPLLGTDQERLEFEAYVSGQDITAGANPPCYICGTADQTVLYPDYILESPTLGKFTCAQLEAWGRQGVTPPENCVFNQAATVVCGCRPLDDDSISDQVFDVPDWVFKLNDTTFEVEQEPYSSPPYLPIWTSAALDLVERPVMYNQLSEDLWVGDIGKMLEAGVPAMSETYVRNGAFFQNYLGYEDEAGVVLFYPVWSSDEEDIVGMVTFDIRWARFVRVFPDLSDMIDIVVENSCGQNVTFTVNTEESELVLKGEGDLHDRAFSAWNISTTWQEVDDLVRLIAARTPEADTCQYIYHVFPTKAFENTYVDSQPVILSFVTAMISVFTASVFVAYDLLVSRRQRKVMESASKTNAIVSSLFPRNVRDRLFEQGANQLLDDSSRKSIRGSKTKMRSFLNGEAKDVVSAASPIADLFPSATVAFLDIAGFTAWSSEREPTQVFRLLEGVYQSFDDEAKRLGVFKVETIGDSYVAVCGLPSKRSDHAPVMVMFAERCLKAMARVTNDLEKYLGPSTGDLKARVGLHSGPVTAGVLRGEKARFQLFGDTMNTASRMEESGKPGRIHVSKVTFDMLAKAGKGHWVKKREDKVTLKGKGEMQTYWVSTNSAASSPSIIDSEDSQHRIQAVMDPVTTARKSKKESRDVVFRLVDWNVEIIYIHLERVMLMRQVRKASNTATKPTSMQLFKTEESIVESRNEGKIVMDELTEVLTLPPFDADEYWDPVTNSAEPEIDVARIKSQLRDFILRIARLYRDVPFHNFEHVSHVVMSASKLMNRIVNPEEVDYQQDPQKVAKDIHDMTFGVSSDPLLQFSMVFSCLIHDVGHTGLTNTELNNMGTKESVRYHQKSVAEQNSVDIAWDILMESKYKELRNCIYQDEEELYRFRQAVVNAVMATDIADKTLKTNRENRWDTAFAQDETSEMTLDTNRKATIVFEYIIQASDVAHTMQHWHTYQKFNRRLFEERYLAWVDGHAERDPSDGWYRGELWFFDNYIIPMAKKLDMCGVFGVSYDEYLSYAIENRKEWEMKGEAIVEEMKEACELQFASKL
eukprot:Nitzschia sp. Nitz4//scaffold52_size167869//61271//65053//NITZ4_002272-RA/size167869-snap-gene-0.211-mRNA-1//1//CDS//3329554023//4009//frame0